MTKNEFSFELITQDDKARLGKILQTEVLLIHLHLCQLELKVL